MERSCAQQRRDVGISGVNRVDRATQDCCLVRPERRLRQRQDTVDTKPHRLPPGLCRRRLAGAGAEQLTEAVKRAGRPFHGVNDDVIHAGGYAGEPQ